MDKKMSQREKEEKMIQDWLKKNKPVKCHDAYEGRSFSDIEAKRGYNKALKLK